MRRRIILTETSLVRHTLSAEVPMPRRSPYAIDLSKAEREELAARARKYTSPYREVLRAKIVLLAAEGLANDVHCGAARHSAADRQQVAQAVLPLAITGPRGGASRRAPSPLFPPASSLKSRRSPVNCPTGADGRCPAGRWRNSAARSSATASWRRSAGRRCGAGSARM